jgi:hypothetical protein
MDTQQQLMPEQSKLSIAFIAYRAIAWSAFAVAVSALDDHFL